IQFDEDAGVIDVGPRRRSRRRWLLLLVIAVVVLLFLSSRVLSIYVSALWFGSLGYASVYWYMFKLKIELFLIFFVLTASILRLAFWVIDRAFASFAIAPRTVLINQQPVQISPGRFLRPLAWIVSILVGIIFGFSMRETWREFALYFHQPATAFSDPIFNKPVSFYLFTLPVYGAISSWLFYLAIIILVASVAYAALAVTQEATIGTAKSGARRTSITVISCALAACLLIIAWNVLLSRYPYLWADHQTFSGVTFMEANYLLRGLWWVAVALLIAAVVAPINAFTLRRIRLLAAGLALPIVVYVIAGML